MGNWSGNNRGDTDTQRSDPGANLPGLSGRAMSATRR